MLLGCCLSVTATNKMTICLGVLERVASFSSIEEYLRTQGLNFYRYFSLGQSFGDRSVQYCTSKPYH